MAASLDRVHGSHPGVTILLYHRVGARTPVAVDLPVDLFERQMAWLADSGLVVSLPDAVEMLRGAAANGPRVVVTFDDGTADFASDALPVLQRHEVPATLYVATRFVEAGETFPDNGRPLSWSALADCLSTGLVTVGSHTHTHALLDRLDRAAARDDLDRSIDLIGTRLGVSPEHFAYPKALPGSPAAAELVRERFKSAAVARTRPNVYGVADVFNLTRSPIQVSDGMRWFKRKAEGGMWAEDSLRRLVNRRRYRNAVT